MTDMLKDAEDFVERVLTDLRDRGLAGCIVRDLPEQLTPPEVASWTGEQHRLVLAGSAEGYRVELCETKNGHWYPVRRSPGPDGLASLTMDFCAREG